MDFAEWLRAERAVVKSQANITPESDTLMRGALLEAATRVVPRLEIIVPKHCAWGHF